MNFFYLSNRTALISIRSENFQAKNERHSLRLKAILNCQILEFNFWLKWWFLKINGTILYHTYIWLYLATEDPLELFSLTCLFRSFSGLPVFCYAVLNLMLPKLTLLHILKLFLFSPFHWFGFFTFTSQRTFFLNFKLRIIAWLKTWISWKGIFKHFITLCSYFFSISC